MKSYNVTFTICHDEIEAESEEEAIDIALEMSREDIRKYPEVFTESAIVTWMNVPISGECRREDHTLCEWLLCDCHCHDNEKTWQNLEPQEPFDHKHHFVPASDNPEDGWTCLYCDLHSDTDPNL